MFSNLRWKRDDFAPVGQLVRWSNVLVTGPSAKLRDLKQLISAGDTGSLNDGSPGVGSLSHLAIETLKDRTGLAMQHVSLTGTPPMINSLLGDCI